MSQPNCVLCPVYYPKAEQHAPDRSQTCEAGRRRLERDRLAVLSMFRRLVEQEELIIDDRVLESTGRPRDPISAALPMATTASVSKKPSVSGSKERQLPINVTVVDLTSPANPHPLSNDADQVGVHSVATVLYRWVNWWRVQLYRSPTLPPRDVEDLMSWIEPRLMAVADKDFEIAFFAEDLVSLRSKLRAALGENEPKPLVMWGVACRRCDTVSSLVMSQEDPDRYRECTAPGCGVLMSEAEYKAWLIESVEKIRAQRKTIAGDADV